MNEWWVRKSIYACYFYHEVSSGGEIVRVLTRDVAEHKRVPTIVLCCIGEEEAVGSGGNIALTTGTSVSLYIHDRNRICLTLFLLWCMVWCGVGVVRCGVAWRGVVWCGAVWRGVV
jgi:hypothetical protein